MCSLYRMISDIETMRRLFSVTGHAPDMPLFPEIYPECKAPIIRSNEAGVRNIELARWGVPPPGNALSPVTTLRTRASRFWRTTLADPRRRCLVPATAFFEWAVEPEPATGRKRKAWFEMRDGDPFVFAGIARAAMDGGFDQFAFLTCAPNTVVGAIHPKEMPVILHGAARDAWLAGDAAESLALPLAGELMRVAPPLHHD